MSEKRISKIIFLPIVLTVIGLVYLFIVTGGFQSFRWPVHYMNGRYDMLAKAFLNGHTYVAELNQSDFNSWDMSLYKDKYYVYFGAVPAILLYLPVAILNIEHLKMPDGIAVFLFCFGVFLLSVSVLKNFKDRYYPRTPRWIFISCVFALGFLSSASALLHNPRIYEVAVSGGVFFIFFSIWGYLKIFSTPKRVYFSLTGLSLALAVGCRPTMAIPSMIIIALASYYHRSNIFKSRLNVISFYLPFILGISALATYNYVRFDSFTEFGITFQRTIWDVSKVQLFSFDRILPGLRFNLFQLPSIIHDFPFFNIERSPITSNLPSPYSLEFPLGMVLSSPLSFMTLTLLFFLPKKIRLYILPKSDSSTTSILPFAIVGLSTFLLICSYPLAVYRFSYEYTPFFVIAACFLWIYWNEAFQRSAVTRRLVSAFVLTSILIGSYMNLFVMTYGDRP